MENHGPSQIINFNGYTFYKGALCKMWSLQHSAYYWFIVNEPTQQQASNVLTFRVANDVERNTVVGTANNVDVGQIYGCSLAYERPGCCATYSSDFPLKPCGSTSNDGSFTPHTHMLYTFVRILIKYATFYELCLLPLPKLPRGVTFSIHVPIINNCRSIQLRK